MRKGFVIFGIFFVIGLFFVGGVNATIYNVKQDGSGDYTTIQACANVAQAGDTCWVYPGIYDERVMFQNSGNNNNRIIFDGTSQQASVLHGFDTNGKDYITIRGFDISHDTGGWLGGAIWLSSNNMDIMNNYFHDVFGEAINSWKGNWSNIRVIGNKMYKVNLGIHAVGDNWLVEGNDVERLYRASVFDPSAYGTDADYSRFLGQNMTFRNNYFHGTLDSEVGTSHVDGFQSFVGGGIIVKNITLEGNIVQSFSEGVMIDQIGESTGLDFEDILIYNNVFFKGNSGIGEKEGTLGVRAYGVSNLQVINNIFVGLLSSAASCKNSKTDGTGSICFFFNNIFLDNVFSYSSDTESTLNSGYNIIWPSATPPSPTDIVANPLILDPNNLVGSDGVPFTSDDGFLISGGSPAIDNGANTLLYGVTKDIFGIIRPQGLAWDIGAYEYVSGAGSSCGAADTSGNSVVEIGELITYISNWKSGSVTIGDLIIAIGEWKNGC